MKAGELTTLCKKGKNRKNGTGRRLGNDAELHMSRPDSAVLVLAVKIAGACKLQALGLQMVHFMHPRVRRQVNCSSVASRRRDLVL